MNKSQIIETFGDRSSHQTKMERFVEMLLLAGNRGVSRWEIIGHLASSSPGHYPGHMRQNGLGLTSGKRYAPITASDFIDCIAYLNKLRNRRGAKPLPTAVCGDLFLRFLAKEQG